MYCPKCGTKQPDEKYINFCGECGYKFTTSEVIEEPLQDEQVEKPVITEILPNNYEEVKNTATLENVIEENDDDDTLYLKEEKEEDTLYLKEEEDEASLYDEDITEMLVPPVESVYKLEEDKYQSDKSEEGKLADNVAINEEMKHEDNAPQSKSPGAFALLFKMLFLPAKVICTNLDHISCGKGFLIMFLSFLFTYICSGTLLSLLSESSDPFASFTSSVFNTPSVVFKLTFYYSLAILLFYFILSFIGFIVYSGIMQGDGKFRDYMKVLLTCYVITNFFFILSNVFMIENPLLSTFFSLFSFIIVFLVFFMGFKEINPNVFIGPYSYVVIFVVSVLILSVIGGSFLDSNSLDILRYLY